MRITHDGITTNLKKTFALRAPSGQSKGRRAESASDGRVGDNRSFKSMI
jgi:hypothetical protein